MFREDSNIANIKTLTKELGIDLETRDFNNIYPIGKIEANKPNPIKIELTSYLKKLEILRNTYKLKGRNIFITQDLSKDDQINHKALRQHLNRAKQNNIKATIKQNKLIVNNKAYTLDQLTQNSDLILGDHEAEEFIESKEENLRKYNRRKETVPETSKTNDISKKETTAKKHEEKQTKKITRSNRPN
ncbi:hypothetical protein NQ314_016983 [Rhamnusium bicolor]|uniref:Uncharacterized protein n=1 Tax=Rhamnusium bicolor TaxID=1586634 RepID=A0AAV8WV53_9CUCU|nr:hypothetical protein NQ314_016983 [Rhamnusium bicolor]